MVSLAVPAKDSGPAPVGGAATLGRRCRPRRSFVALVVTGGFVLARPAGFQLAPSRLGFRAHLGFDRALRPGAAAPPKLPLVHEVARPGRQPPKESADGTRGFCSLRSQAHDHFRTVLSEAPLDEVHVDQLADEVRERSWCEVESFRKFVLRAVGRLTGNLFPKVVPTNNADRPLRELFVSRAACSPMLRFRADQAQYDARR